VSILLLLWDRMNTGSHFNTITSPSSENARLPPSFCDLTGP
jgi:hypothetical protein